MSFAQTFGSFFQRPPRRGLCRIEKIELHVTHACNLTCDNCAHYSNYNHRGNLPLAEADRWMGLWSRRIAMDEFHLLGGEPTIHPELPEFVRLVRRHWQDTDIYIRTNGVFLHRHPALPALMQADPRVFVQVTIHHGSAEYAEHMRPVFELIARWEREYGIKVDAGPSYATWTQRYQGYGAAMEPFEEGAPRASWEVCPARRCKQLFEGKIWKCAPLTYLRMQKATVGLSPKWDFYLGYEPLDPSCSDRDRDAFFARQEESYCGMCPTKRIPLDLDIPLPRSRLRAPPRLVPELDARGAAGT